MPRLRPPPRWRWWIGHGDSASGHGNDEDPPKRVPVASAAPRAGGNLCYGPNGGQFGFMSDEVQGVALQTLADETDPSKGN
jgi:hypothetical protein